MSDKIKMSDEFSLPVSKAPGGIMPFLKDCNGIVIYVGDDAHVDATIAAINAYDNNQLEIVLQSAQLIDAKNEITELTTIVDRYQKLVCQTCDGHGAVGNILDSMDCPDCTLYVGPTEEIAKQQTEINDQQRKIEDKTRLIKQVDKANSQMATEINELNETCNHQEHCNDELRKEIAELKAALQLWVYMIDSGCSDHSDINEHNAEVTRKLLDAK